MAASRRAATTARRASGRCATPSPRRPSASDEEATAPTRLRFEDAVLACFASKKLWRLDLVTGEWRGLGVPAAGAAPALPAGELVLVGGGGIPWSSLRWRAALRGSLDRRGGGRRRLVGRLRPGRGFRRPALLRVARRRPWRRSRPWRITRGRRHGRRDGGGRVVAWRRRVALIEDRVPLWRATLRQAPC